MDAHVICQDLAEVQDDSNYFLFDAAADRCLLFNRFEIGGCALVSGLACAYVHRQRKALHGEGERMPEGGAGGGAGGGHDLEQQSPGLKGKTVEVRFA